LKAGLLVSKQHEKPGKPGVPIMSNNPEEEFKNMDFNSAELSCKPILRRLMIPLTMVFALLLIGFITLITTQYDSRLNESSQWILKDATNEWVRALAEQSRSLAAVESVLIQDCSGLRTGKGC
jgi:hypothetical protein